MIEIIADGRKQVAEADDENNTLTVYLTCGPVAQADLVISNMLFNGSTIIYDITNIGQAGAGASWTRLRIDDTLVAEDYVGPLAPGQTRRLSFDYSYACSGFGDVMEIIADGRKRVAETDDENNTLTVYLTCGPVAQGPGDKQHAL